MCRTGCSPERSDTRNTRRLGRAIPPTPTPHAYAGALLHRRRHAGYFFMLFPRRTFRSSPACRPEKRPLLPLFRLSLTLQRKNMQEIPGPDSEPRRRRRARLPRIPEAVLPTADNVPEGREPCGRNGIKKEHVKKRALFPLSKEKFLPGSPGGLQKRPFPALTADRPLFRATSWQQPERWRT